MPTFCLTFDLVVPAKAGAWSMVKSIKWSIELPKPRSSSRLSQIGIGIQTYADFGAFRLHKWRQSDAIIGGEVVAIVLATSAEKDRNVVESSELVAEIDAMY